jgi:hypothetical protein
MRMLTGAILILAAAVLFAAWWLAKALHNAALSGTPESGYLVVVALLLGVVGVVVLVIGFARDRPKA